MNDVRHDPFWGLDPEQRRMAKEQRDIEAAIGRVSVELLWVRSVAAREPILEKELAELEKKALEGMGE